MKTGPCAKTTVVCTLVTPDGRHIVGTNYCNNAQAVCPRLPGEGYEKCKTICDQEGHAEIVALKLAGDLAKGSRAYLKGHTYACQQCKEALSAAGVVSMSVGIVPGSDMAPPRAQEAENWLDRELRCACEAVDKWPEWMKYRPHAEALEKHAAAVKRGEE